MFNPHLPQVARWLAIPTLVVFSFLLTGSLTFAEIRTKAEFAEKIKKLKSKSSSDEEIELLRELIPAARRLYANEPSAFGYTCSLQPTPLARRP